MSTLLQQLQTAISLPRSIDDIKTAYDGSTIVNRLLRSNFWGPEFLNLGYFPNYFGFGRFLHLLADLNNLQRNLVINGVKYLDVKKNQHVLDVGCGRGGSGFVLRQSTDAAQIDAIDLLDENIRIANMIFPACPRLKFLQADAHDLPFPDQSYDRVFCCEAAFHFADRATFLQESARVLKPGGKLVLIDFIWKNAEQRKFLEFPETKLVRHIWQWDDMSTEEEYLRQATSAGLKTAKIIDWTNYVTRPLQRRFRTGVWLAKSRWGNFFQTSFNPLMSNFSVEEWAQIEKACLAHEFVTQKTQYKVYIFVKPTSVSVK